MKSDGKFVLGGGDDEDEAAPVSESGEDMDDTELSDALSLFNSAMKKGNMTAAAEAFRSAVQAVKG